MARDKKQKKAPQDFKTPQDFKDFLDKMPKQKKENLLAEVFTTEVFAELSDPFLDDLEQKYTGRQPRSISPPAGQEPEPSYFRSPMLLEGVKTGKTPDELKLEKKTIEQIGVNLSLAEGRALHAIQRKLQATDYKGNEAGKNDDFPEFSFKGFLPIVSMSYSEYYKLYGLKPGKTGSYHGGEREAALKALRSLDERKHTVVYTKTSGKYKAGKPLFNIIRTTDSLIELEEISPNWTAEEIEQRRTGQKLPDITDQRRTRLFILVSPLLVDKIENFYALLPPDLHNDIQKATGKRQYDIATYYFINFLCQLDIPALPIKKEKLAARLWLNKELKSSRHKRIDQKIKQALETARKMNYLERYEIIPGSSWKEGMIKLWLNPKNCRRVQAKQKRQKKLEDKRQNEKDSNITK